MHYPDQGRYSDLQFRFSAEGYRAEVMEIEASYIDYSNVFPKRSQDVYEINARPIQLKKAQGIADIIIKSDNKSMLYKENTRSNIEIKIGKKVNAYSFRKKWDKPIFGKTSHRYENGIGRYFIKVSAPGFQKQPVAKFDIVDGEDKVIDIELKYKSKLQAFMWSSLMPGTGHVYMQKGTLKNNFIPLGIYSLSLAAAIKYHSSYQGHRSDFLNYQKQFTVSTDRMLSDENRKMAKESWGQMQDAKNYFIGMTASAILTNLVTSIMLMVTS